MKKSKKSVKMLAMVMAVVMLASAMMVQAFAGSSTSRTINGYNASAYVSRNSSFRAYGETTYDGGSAPVEMDIWGFYIIPSSGEQHRFDATGGAHHYQVTVYAESRPSANYSKCLVYGIGTVYGEDLDRVDASFG